MANELKGVVSFKDDQDQEWKISYPVNTLIDIEDATGKKISDLLTELASGESLKLVRTFTFYGLRTHHPDITEAKAGDLMSFGSKAAEASMQAIMLAFPKAKPDDQPSAQGDSPNA